MIFFSAVLATLRTEQVVECLEFEAAPAAGHVSQKFVDFERMVTGNEKESREFREKFSGCDIWRDGRLRCSLNWPSAAEATERDRLERLNRAKDMLEQAKDRQKILDEAAAKAAAGFAEVTAAQAEVAALEAEATAKPAAKKR